MLYNPFARGVHPVGVRTIEFVDEALSSRPVPTELWYPATDAFRGKDLDESTMDQYVAVAGLPTMTQQAVRDAKPLAGRFPLFMYFHGGYGQRRECSHLCTHLASHAAEQTVNGARRRASCRCQRTHGHGIGPSLGDKFLRFVKKIAPSRIVVQSRAAHG